MNQDNIIRAYARLVALKDHLPKDGWGIKEGYINDYHQIIGILSKEIESSLDEFKIPNGEINYKVTSFWPDDPDTGERGGQTHTDERYCERALFLSKIDAILSYFQIVYLSKGEEKKKIGFQSPD